MWSSRFCAQFCRWRFLFDPCFLLYILFGRPSREACRKMGHCRRARRAQGCRLSDGLASWFAWISTFRSRRNPHRSPSGPRGRVPALAVLCWDPILRIDNLNQHALVLLEIANAGHDCLGARRLRPLLSQPLLCIGSNSDFYVPLCDGRSRATSSSAFTGQ